MQLPLKSNYKLCRVCTDLILNEIDLINAENELKAILGKDQEEEPLKRRWGLIYG